MSTISFPASTPSSLHYFNVKSRSSFTFRGLISEPLIDICKSVFSTIKERPFETLSFTATVVLNWTHIKSQSPEIATLATGYQILHNGKTAWELIPQFKKKAFLNTVVKVSFFAIALYIGVAIPTIDTIAKYAVEEYIKCYQAGKSLEDCHALLPPWLNFDIKAIVKHPNQAISVTQTISSSKVCIYTKLTPYSHVSKTCFSDDHCPSEVFSDFEFPLPSPIAHGETHLEFTLYTGLNIRYYRFRLPLVIKENINPDICIVTHEVALNQTTKVCIDSENLMIVKQLIEDSEFNNHFDLPHSRAEIESTYVMFRQKHENELALSLPSAQQDVSAVEVHPLYTPNPGMLINVTIIKPKVSALKAYIESRKKPAIIKPPKKPTILQHFLKLFLLTPTDTPSDTSQEESLDSLSDEELLEGLKNVNENDKSHESEKTKSYFNALKKRILSDPFIVSVVIALVDKKQLSMAVAMAENIDDSKIKAKTAYVIIDKAIKKGHQKPASNALNLISDKEIREKEKTRIQTEFHQKHTKQTASSSSGSPEKNVANTIKTVENPLKEFIHDPREAARRHSPDDLSEISPDYDSIKSKLKELDLKFFRAGKGTHEIWGIEGVEITVILPNIKGAIGTARNVIRRAYLIKDLSEIQKNQASSSGAI